MTGNADLARRLAMAVQLALSHEEESTALREQLDALQTLLETGGARALSTDGEDLLVNEERVVFEDELEGVEYTQMIRDVFETVGIAGLVFVEAVDAEELAELMRALRQGFRAPTPGAFAGRRFTRIVVVALPSLRGRTRAMVTSWLSLRADVAHLRSAIGGADESAALLAAIRRLHRAADSPTPLRPLQIALAMRPSPHDVDHACSCATLAMLAGSCAGASREALTRLAIAGLLHALHGHTPPSVAMGIAAAVHHSPNEASELSAALLPCATTFPDAAGAIVSAVCELHGLLQQVGCDAAYRKLADGSDDRRRTTIRLLAHALGTYPPGTAVRLSRGEAGVVIRSSRDAALADQPVVRVLREGTAPVDYMADLSEKSSPRRVVGSIAFSRAGFDGLREFLEAWSSR